MPGPSQEFKNRYPHLFSGNANLLDKREIPFIKNNPNLFAGQNLTDNAIDSKKNIDVDAELQSAIKQKDVTPDIARQLKKEYGHDPKALKQKLDTYKGERYKYLMSLSWDELDKKGLLSELKESAYAGYRKKFFLKFGKEPKEQAEKNKKEGISDTDIKNKEALLLGGDRWDKSNLDFWKQGFKGDTNKYNDWLDKQIAIDEKDYSEKSWDELDKEGLLPEIKDNHLSLFKQKYKDKFGVDYKDKAATNKPPSLSDTSVPALDKSYYIDSWHVLDKQGKLETLKPKILTYSG